MQGGNALIVIASKNGKIGLQESMCKLRAGGSAVDAVEAGVRLVEANPDDHSVGCGGYPNLLGQVELDAGIMDGRSLEAGSVGAMQGFKYPISVARRLMESLPHVFLVGEGAERFASEMGCERGELLTPEAQSVWEGRLREDRPGEDLSQLAQRKDLWQWVEKTADLGRPMGTVTFMVRDSHGNIAAGVSTSGWPWKYPGRLGDTPVIGAGLYADNRAGAATCTGMGEMAIRACTARSIVLYQMMGMLLAEVGRRAMEDLDALGGRYLSNMNFIVMDRDGCHAGFSNAEDMSYVFLAEGMEEPAEAKYTYTKTKTRWGARVQSCQNMPV